MEDSRLNCLPSEIILNIFSKLPVELVLDCKRVCRAWRNLIQFQPNTNNYFANLHLQYQHDSHPKRQDPHQPSHDSSDSSMVSFVSCFDRKDLYYAEYYEDYKMNPRKEHYSTKRISLKFLEGDVRLVGSCNGLICLSVERSYDKPDSSTYNDGYEESFYICNLIIGEVVNLPGMCISNRRKTVQGFGYHPLTNEYKVLRISYYGYGSINEPPYKGQVEVYTLGSGSGWRSKGEIKYHVWPNIHGGSVCVNGALHWLQEGSEEIVAFDLANEKFYLLQAPPNGRQEPFSRRLGVFRGCLVLVNEFLELGINPWHLWFLKKDNSIYNTREFYTKDPCWSQEYAILLRSMKRFPYLFAISEEGQVLLMGRFGYVVRYNLLESQTSDDIWEFDEHKKSWELPIPHRNTFVSLKALGEENVGTFTAGGELKFPNSGKKKYGVIKIVPPTTSETYAKVLNGPALRWWVYKKC